MDKYARQSHKTYQHARRRNNTAEHVLDNTLKQLDKDIRSRQIFYMRNRNRVRGELFNLEGISSDFDLLSQENNRASEKEETQHNNWSINTPNYNDMGGREMKLDTVSRCAKSDNRNINRRKTVSSFSSLSSIENHHRISSASGLSETIPDIVVTSTPFDFIDSQRNFGKRRSGSNFDGMFKPGSCEYNHFNLAMPHVCTHFPCKKPETYHTIGFRREDLCPRTDDNVNDEYSEDTIPSVFTRKESNIRDNEFPGHRPEMQLNHPKPFNTNWIKRKEKPRHPFEFRPTIHGPVFGYTPTDPVLERIREQQVEPQLNASRPCARVTIRDRIRGVKQLVKEMKLSIQKVKPDDWATNYGKRVPTRILLNPVVPV